MRPPHFHRRCHGLGCVMKAKEVKKLAEALLAVVEEFMNALPSIYSS